MRTVADMMGRKELGKGASGRSASRATRSVAEGLPTQSAGTRQTVLDQEFQSLLQEDAEAPEPAILPETGKHEMIQVNPALMTPQMLLDVFTLAKKMNPKLSKEAWMKAVVEQSGVSKSSIEKILHSVKRDAKYTRNLTPELAQKLAAVVCAEHRQTA